MGGDGVGQPRHAVLEHLPLPVDRAAARVEGGSIGVNAFPHGRSEPGQRLEQPLHFLLHEGDHGRLVARAEVGLDACHLLVEAIQQLIVNTSFIWVWMPAFSSSMLRCTAMAKRGSTSQSLGKWLASRSPGRGEPSSSVSPRCPRRTGSYSRKRRWLAPRLGDGTRIRRLMHETTPSWLTSAEAEGSTRR